MTDPHLNLFYTYNRDNQLIENNLTRAWIVALQTISGITRNRLFHDLLGSHAAARGIDLPDFSLLDFSSAHFALQSNIDRDAIRTYAHKFVLTVATSRVFEPGEGHVNLDVVSIPDAWITLPAQGFCLLVEAKIGSNPLSDAQLVQHAWTWLGIPRERLGDHLLSISWHDVVESLAEAIPTAANPQEAAILEHLLAYLEMYGYRLFRGFTFDALDQVPAFRLSTPHFQFEFSALSEPPTFSLRTLTEE